MQSPGGVDGGAVAGGFLIDDGFAVTVLATVDGDDEVAAAIDAGAAGFEGDLNGVRVGARGDDPIVLEVAFIAVVDEVDTGVGVAVADARVVGDCGAPLAGVAAGEVVGGGGLAVFAGEARGGIGAGESHAERGGAEAAEFDLAGGEGQGVDAAAGDESLAGSGFEAQGEIAPLDHGSGHGGAGEEQKRGAHVRILLQTLFDRDGSALGVGYHSGGEKRTGDRRPVFS